MVMLAHLIEHGEQRGDRRGSARRALRLDVATNADSQSGARVTVHDLSLTGALLETSTALSPGEAIQVQLPDAVSVEAMVVWNSGEFYGCQFRQPISPAALSAAVLQSAPRRPNSPTGTDVVAELRIINEQVEKIAADVERAVSRLARSRRDPSDV